MRKMRKGDKMSRDEYNALKVGLGPSPARGASTADRGARNAGLTCCSGPPSPQRKVGGTYDGFIGEWVDVKGKYIEDGARRPTPTVPPPLSRGAMRTVADPGDSRRLRGGGRRLQLGQPAVHPRHRRPRRRDRAHPPGHQLRMDSLAHILFIHIHIDAHYRIRRQTLSVP